MLLLPLRLTGNGDDCVQGGSLYPENLGHCRWDGKISVREEVTRFYFYNTRFFYYPFGLLNYVIICI